MAHDAAIRWSFKTVLSHFLYQSNVSTKSLFGAMFPDSEVTKQYTINKDNVSCFVIYGIAPLFKEELITVNKSSFYSIGFDESLIICCKITKWTFMFDFGIQRRAKQRQHSLHGCSSRKLPLRPATGTVAWYYESWSKGNEHVIDGRSKCKLVGTRVGK